MQRLLTIRAILVLIGIMALSAGWCAQLGEGTVITAQSSLRELRSHDLAPERHDELITGMERLVLVQARMFRVLLYGAFGLLLLTFAMHYSVKPRRPAVTAVSANSGGMS